MPRHELAVRLHRRERIAELVHRRRDGVVACTQTELQLLAVETQLRRARDERLALLDPLERRRRGAAEDLEHMQIRGVERTAGTERHEHQALAGRHRQTVRSQPRRYAITRDGRRDLGVEIADETLAIAR